MRTAWRPPGPTFSSHPAQFWKSGSCSSESGWIGRELPGFIYYFEGIERCVVAQGHERNRQLALRVGLHSMESKRNRPIAAVRFFKDVEAALRRYAVA